MINDWFPGAYKRNVYLFQDDHTEKRDSVLPASGWVRDQLRDERFDRATADDALLKEIENETSRATIAEDSKEDLRNKVASDVSYISDDTHYATTATVDQRIADISPKQIEWATYGTTTSAQLDEWLTANKVVLLKYNNDSQIMRLDYRDSATKHIFHSVWTSGASSLPKLYEVQCNSNIWTNTYMNLQTTSNMVRTTDTWSSVDSKYPTTAAVDNRFEKKNNKLTSTSDWASDDTKYPTTKAVENYVAEHAPEPLDLDVQAHDGDVRVFRVDASSVSYAYGGQVGKVYPFINDFIRRDGSANSTSTADSYVTIKNYSSGTKRMLNIAAIRESCYYVRRPSFSINGLAAKYYSSTNNTGKKMLQAMIADGYHLFLNFPINGSLHLSYDMTTYWTKADLDSVGNGIGYYDSPKILSGTSDLYECAWYAENTTHGWYQLDIHEDGTPSASSHKYRVLPCITLRKFSTSQPNSTTALKFECAYILLDQSTGGNWDGCIVDGAFSMQSSTSIGDGSVSGAVIAKRYGMDKFEGANTWMALTCSTGMSFQASSAAAVAPWGIKIVDDEDYKLDDTHCIAQGIAKCDRSVPTPPQPGDSTMYWRGGTAWRRWKKVQSNSHDQKYPWGDLLTRAKPAESQTGQDAKVWHQVGAMPPTTTTKMVNSHPDGWWQPNDIVETCWSPDPGWIVVDGSYSFAGAQGSLISGTGSFTGSPMWHNMAWFQNSNFPQYRRDPVSDNKFVANYSISFRDFSTTYAFYSDTGTSRTAVYVDKDLFANANDTVKTQWRFVVDGIRYLLYPALMSSNNCLKKCLVVIHEGSEWGVADKDPDYPWHSFVFDGGYIVTENGNLGLIQSGINTDAATSPGNSWCLWSDPSGTSNTVRNFWTYTDKFCYMDTNKGCIVGSKQDSSDKYINSPYLGAWTIKFSEASVPVSGKPISEIDAASFPQLFDYNALDIVEDSSDATTYKRYYSTANSIDMVDKTATSYYIDPDTKELVLGTWDWNKTNYTDHATKTEERIALGGGGGGIGTENIIFCSQYLLGGWDVHQPTYSDSYGHTLMASLGYRCNNNESHYGTAILDLDNSLHANWWTIGHENGGRPYLKFFRADGVGTTPTAYAEYDLTPKVVKDFIVNGTYNDAQSSYDIQLGASGGRVVRIKGHPDSPDTILTMVSYTGGYPNNYVAKFTGIDVDNSGNPTLYWVRHEIGTSATGKWWYYGKKAL